MENKLITFKDLIVWRKSIDLCTLVYETCSFLPKEETFGLSSQMKRAVISISSNMAEGRMRGSRKDLTQFLRISNGSLAELETQIIVLKTLPFGRNLDYNKIDSLVLEIRKMLNSMIFKLKA